MKSFIWSTQGQAYSKFSEIKKKNKKIFWALNYSSAFLLLFDIKFINNLPLKTEEALNITYCRTI